MSPKINDTTIFLIPTYSNRIPLGRGGISISERMGVIGLDASANARHEE